MMLKVILTLCLFLLLATGCRQSQTPDELSYYSRSVRVVVYIDDDPGLEYVQKGVKDIRGRQSIDSIVEEIRKLDSKWIPTKSHDRPYARIAAIYNSKFYGTIFFTPPTEPDLPFYFQTKIGGTLHETSVPRGDYNRLVDLLGNPDLSQNDSQPQTVGSTGTK